MFVCDSRVLTEALTCAGWPSYTISSGTDFSTMWKYGGAARARVVGASTRSGQIVYRKIAGGTAIEYHVEIW
jgi:hypothetical protein